MPKVDVLKFCLASQEDKNLSRQIEKSLRKLDNKNASYEDILHVAEDISLLGKNYNCNFTSQELFDYLENECKYLSDEDLMNVVGGLGRKATSVGLSAIAILSLGTGAACFFNRSNENIKARNSAVFSRSPNNSASALDDEDLSLSINENRKFKGGRNNWRDLLNNFGKSKKIEFNKPSFVRRNPAEFDRERKNLSKSNSKLENNIGKFLRNDVSNKVINPIETNNITINGEVQNLNPEKKYVVKSKDFNIDKNTNVKEKDLSLPRNINSEGNGITTNGLYSSNNVNDSNNSSSKTNLESNKQTNTAKFNIKINDSNFGNKGIVNISNSCYLNTALQQLYNNSTFKNNILNADVIPNEHPYTGALKKLFIAISKGNVEKKDVEDFLKVFKNIYDKNQQDANECFVKIIEAVEKEDIIDFDDVKFNAEETLYDESGSKISSNKQEDINFININVSENKDKKSLSNCFSRNGTYDVQNIEDYNHNGENIKAKKETKITKFPEDLTIILNRYGYDKEENVYFKVTDSLDISEKINISGNKYTLKVISVHVGKKMNSGHYIAYVRDGEKWMKIDDDKVSNVNFNDIKDEISKNATMVTYEKD